MKVIVRDNQIEKAIKDLKRKLVKDGFFSEIKERRFYDKPSVQKKKKQAGLRMIKKRSIPKSQLKPTNWTRPISVTTSNGKERILKSTN